MMIILNGTATMHTNVVTDIRICKELGFAGIEITRPKITNWLEAGYQAADLKDFLGDLPVIALGYVQDIERHEAKEYDELLEECRLFCSTAQELGCSTVQLLTGPIGPGINDFTGYQGMMGQPYKEVLAQTVKNLKVLADIGADYGVKFYLEPLSWTPLHRLEQCIELIDKTGKDNVGMVIDFWHLWTSGNTPEEVAKVDKRYIFAAHYCDSLVVPEGMDIISHDLRHVWTGGGHIPLKEWVDAVKATGYDGWWSCELFSPKHWELDPWLTARLLKEQLELLLY